MEMIRNDVAKAVAAAFVVLNGPKRADHDAYICAQSARPVELPALELPL